MIAVFRVLPRPELEPPMPLLILRILFAMFRWCSGEKRSLGLGVRFLEPPRESGLLSFLLILLAQPAIQPAHPQAKRQGGDYCAKWDEVDDDHAVVAFHAVC